ncbi:MAG TPA: alpha/beta hydrolase [Burkholderiaceae bacterium]
MGADMTHEPAACTVVLLPGMDGTGLLFQPWIAAKPDGFDLRVIDYPVDAALGYQELLPLVRVRLPQDRPYILLAESFSGPLGLMLAAEAPSGLAGLILCCTFAKNPLPWLVFAKPLLGGTGFLVSPALLARLGHRALFGRFADAQTKAALSGALRRLHPSVLQARMLAVLGADVSALLPRVCVPALYLSAGEDRVVPASALRRLVEALPRMRISRIATPHMLLQTAPQEAWKAVVTFLDHCRAKDDVEPRMEARIDRA